MVLRYAVPPLFGATFSLGLLYLYQESLVSRHSHLRSGISQTEDALSDARDRINHKLHKAAGHKGSATQAEEEVQYNRTSWQQARYQSLGDEFKARWNRDLAQVTSTISTLPWDRYADTALAATASLLHSASSAVRSGVSRATEGGSGIGTDSGSVGSSGGLLASPNAPGMSLRSADEVKMKAKEVGEGILKPGKEDVSLR